MNRALLLALLLRVPLSTPQEEASRKQAHGQTVTHIEQAVFRSVVRKYCQQTLCLLAVKGKALEEERLSALAELGRVAAPSAEDLEMDGSGMSGAARSKGAQVVDITKIITEKNDTVTAHVSMYATVIDATLCKLRVRQKGGDWEVDEKATTCAR